MKVLFPPLRDAIASLPRQATPRPLRVCFITSHFAGPAKTSGLGTAYLALAAALAEDGHEVTVLYLRGRKSDQHDIGYWQTHYAARKITLVPLPDYHEAAAAPYYRRRPFEAFLWLARQPGFDLIHYSDCYGVGHVVALMKKRGLAFRNTTLCAGIHGASAWINRLNGKTAPDEMDAAHDKMERFGVANADIAISPSQFMLKRLQDEGWVLPPQTFVQQNILPFAPARPAREARVVDELVFFGRLEFRKGLALFCDACDLLAAQSLSGFTVAFLGNSVALPDGGDSLAYIAHRAINWPFPHRILPDKGLDEARSYLSAAGKLAVMPSLEENSPYTVLECIGNAVPFIATDVGGTGELIAAADRAGVCCAPEGAALTDSLRRVMAQGAVRARPAADFAANKTDWLEWHRALPCCNRSGEAARHNGLDAGEDFLRDVLLGKIL